MRDEGTPPPPVRGGGIVTRVVRTADIGATFLFATEGALAGVRVHLDPIGLLVLAFLTGLGGGVLRDLLIACGRPAAIADGRYLVTIIVAAAAAWMLAPFAALRESAAVVTFDAAALSLAAVAGVEKALDNGVVPSVAVALGGLLGVGGGMLRDLMLAGVPRVLRSDVYATAALVGALVVVGGRRAGLGGRTCALAGGAACFGLRMIAWSRGWNLPAAG